MKFRRQRKGGRPRTGSECPRSGDRGVQAVKNTFDIERQTPFFTPEPESSGVAESSRSDLYSPGTTRHPTATGGQDQLPVETGGTVR